MPCVEKVKRAEEAAAVGKRRSDPKGTISVPCGKLGMSLQEGMKTLSKGKVQENPSLSTTNGIGGLVSRGGG